MYGREEVIVRFSHGGRRQESRRSQPAQEVTVGTAVSCRPPAQIRTCPLRHPLLPWVWTASGTAAPATGDGSSRMAKKAAAEAVAIARRIRSTAWARSPDSASGACFGEPNSPWFHPFAPPAPPRVAPLCSPASSLLWMNPIASFRRYSPCDPGATPRGEMKPSQVPEQDLRTCRSQSAARKPPLPRDAAQAELLESFVSAEPTAVPTHRSSATGCVSEHR